MPRVPVNLAFSQVRLDLSGLPALATISPRCPRLKALRAADCPRLKALGAELLATCALEELVLRGSAIESPRCGTDC